MKSNLLFAAAAAMVISACGGIAPTADHHQHLMSPTAAAVYSPPPLPAVELPADLAQLLTQRAERTKDLAALRQLYTPDAWVLRYTMPGWSRGDEALGSLATVFYGADKLTPVFLRTNGSTSNIGGYYTRSKDARHLGYFHMTVEKTPGGALLITSETPSFPIPPVQKPIFADDLIARLDEAGIQRAVVLSNAYFFDGLVPVSGSGDRYAMVRAENDWTAGQVMRHPDRLVALCSFNPTNDYAVAELERCSKNSAFTGVKLHFGTSPVDLHDPEHVAKTRRVFEAANRLRLPLLVHTSGSPGWGKEQAEIFLKELVAAAPDVQVVVAHLWGGAFYNEPALGVFADAISSGNPAAKNLYFETASVYGDEEMMKTLAQRMRQIGLHRIYFGSDAPPEDAWDDFHRKVPLTKEEMKRFVANVAPWAQRRPA